MKYHKSFPHFKQNSSYDCGPTSLRMIAKFYGQNYSQEMLRKHCHITRRVHTLIINKFCCIWYI